MNRRFSTLLKKLVQDGNTRFRFDLLNVREIDSVGLSAFIVLFKIMAKRSEKPDLEIINACRDVARLFRMTNLDNAYGIKEDIRDDH